MIKNTALVASADTWLRKTTLDGREASAEMAGRYTKAIRRERLYSEP